MTLSGTVNLFLEQGIRQAILWSGQSGRLSGGSGQMPPCVVIDIPHILNRVDFDI